MNIPLPTGMTADEFLAWEDQQPHPDEFDGARVIAMTGSTEAHADILANLITALGARLRGQICRAYGWRMKVSVYGSFRYPDALIVCGPRDARRTIAQDPVVIFEILSESTGVTDRITRALEYRNTPSIQRYVILEQTGIGALVFTRRKGDWFAKPQGSGSILAIPEAGIELQLDALYEGLTFDPAQSE